MEITFDSKNQAFIQSKIASGSYQDASEMINEVLHREEQREAAREKKIEELRAMIQAGIDSGKDGKRYSAEEVFEHFKEKSRKRRAGEA